MKYALFLGCTTLSRLPAYEKSVRKLCEKLGIELADMSGSGCCGTTYMESLDEPTALSLAARNICIAEQMGLDILTVCGGCTEVLTKANTALKGDPQLRGEVNEILKEAGREFRGTAQVKHLTRVLAEDIGVDKLRKAASRPLGGLRVAAHPGCHITKPSKLLKADDPYHPEVLDTLIEATGAISLQYRRKNWCCGAPAAAADQELGLRVLNEKLTQIERSGADCVVTACSYCHLQFERGQPLIEDRLGVEHDLPVVDVTQLLGLATGIPPRELGLDPNDPKTRKILQKIGNQGGTP